MCRGEESEKEVSRPTDLKESTTHAKHEAEQLVSELEKCLEETEMRSELVQ